MVYKHKVDNALLVRIVPKVFVIVTRKASVNAMVFVHHAGNAVEAKTIEAIDLNPIAQVAEQEPEDLVGAIIE